MGNATIIGSGIGSNATGGLPPSICRNMTIKVDGTSVKLKWQDPDDTILDRQVLCTWAGTKIVKKLGSYPENEDDGTLVLDSTVRNQYLENEYVDTIVADEDWKYSASPRGAESLPQSDQHTQSG